MKGSEGKILPAGTYLKDWSTPKSEFGDFICGILERSNDGRVWFQAINGKL